MKKVWPFLLLVLAFINGCITPQVAFNEHADFSQIHRVAVATFGGPGGDVAADLLTQDLLAHGADVVERQRLDAVLQEQNLANDNALMTPDTVRKVGQILGVDAIFVGNVSENVESQSYLVTSHRHGDGGNVTPVGSGSLYSEGPAEGVPDSQIVTSAAEAALIARMVDVETGSILWSGRMSYEGLDSQNTMAGITASFVKSLVPLWPALHK